jgi:uncharacterized membrane protein
MIARLIIIASILFSFWTTSALAEDTYEVAGVDTDDVLNIRKNPSASAPKVGEYRPGESGIRIYRRKGNWALAGRYDPKNPDGWVHARYLKLTVAAARVELPKSCAGTEPFWNIEINSEREARYSQPDGSPQAFKVTEFSRSGRNASMKLDSGGKVSVMAQSCSDGMSDNVYPYAVRVDLPDGRQLNGCCDQ